MANEYPRLLGRFNYTTFKEGIYNIVFTPFHGSIQVVVAKNLSWKDVQEFLEDLNAITADIYQLSLDSQQFATEKVEE